MPKLSSIHVQNVARWSGDDYAFGRELLNLKEWKPGKIFTPDQETLRDLIRNNKYVACTSGHGTGKSYILAFTVIHFMVTNPGCWVVTTSASWELVENVLWREIRDMYLRARMPIGGRLLDTEWSLGEKWVATGISTDSATRFQGKHSGRVLVIADEATGIAPDIWQAMESLALSPEDRIVAVGNPTDATSEFYRQCQLGGKWRRFQMSCLNHPNVITGEPLIPGAVTRSYVDGVARDFGPDSPVYEARVLGQWSTKVGRMFPDFDPNVGGRHVYDPRVVIIPDWWTRFISIDIGFAHNTAILFFAYDGRNMYVYDELVQNEKTATELGELIGWRANPRAHKGEESKIAYVALSHDAFNRVESQISRADVMGDTLEAWGIPRPISASKDRIGGWNLITTMLRGGTLKISAACPNLIFKMKEALRDPKKPEDMLKAEGDDEMDALYKGVGTQPPSPVLTIEQRINQAVTATDPHNRAMQARIAAAREASQDGPVFMTMRRGWRQ